MVGKSFFRKFSLLPQGLRYKLLIAFSLMSVIPLLVIGYLANTFILLDEEPLLSQVSLMILFCVIIAWLGLFLAKGIIERVIDMALEARFIAEGNYDRKISVDAGDEIGQIGESVNALTRKIKNSITDLKDYQGKMKEINLDVQKKVLILSNLLQVGELISSSVKLDEVLALILRKLSQIADGGFAALYFSREADNRFTLRLSHNPENKNLQDLSIEEGKGLLGKVMQKRKHVVVDASSRLSSREHEQFNKIYKCENAVAFPISTIKELKALLLVGNDAKNFTYTNEDVEVLKIFVEQISIAIENDILVKKAEKLEIKDTLTKLFNKPYMMHRLDEEIKRSVVSQRPCSFVLVDIDDFKKYMEKRGRPQAEIVLKRIARFINEFSTPLGRAGRIDEDGFALILPEVNKKEALEIAEKIRKEIENLELPSEKSERLTVSGGVSENPLDGSSAEEIYEKAKEALIKAKQKGKNKILTSGV